MSEHPLFRALVLMGGGLALSCGGVARTDPDSAANTGASGSGSASGAAAASGAASASGSTAAAGGLGDATTTDPGQGTAASGGSAGEAAPMLLNCPTEQVDCGVPADVCGALDLPSAVAAGLCVCDRSRPASVKDCKPNENMVCLAGYLPPPAAQTPDGATRIRCTCIPSQVPATFESCSAACQQAAYGPSCTLPNPCTYDASGACTATAADVLYQAGIICGCANIGLK